MAFNSSDKVSVRKCIWPLCACQIVVTRWRDPGIFRQLLCTHVCMRRDHESEGVSTCHITQVILTPWISMWCNTYYEDSIVLSNFHKRNQIWIFIHIWGVSRQLPQRAAREPQIVLFLTHVYDTKTYFKNCLSVSDVFFHQLSNGVGSFSEIFHFYLQKV